MKKKLRRQVASLVFLVQTAQAAVSAAPSAWVKPNWGFAGQSDPSKKKLARSLIFDQHFDKASVRPLPFVFSERSPARDAAPAQMQVTPTVERVALKSDEPLHYAPPPEPANETPKEETKPIVVAPELVAPKPIVVAALQTPSLATPAPIVAKLVAPVPAPKPEPLRVPAPTPTPVVPTPVPQHEAHEAEAIIPNSQHGAATIFVMSEESLLLGKPRGLPNVQITWVGPQSGQQSKTDKNGAVRAPYPISYSLRFIAEAPGYLPAVGYAVQDRLTPVVMIAESRLGAIVKSLGISIEPGRHIVLGKLLDEQLKPVADLNVDATVQLPFRSYYSLGSFGLYHLEAKRSGPQGDFLVTGLGDGLQYLMPTQNEAKDWAPGVADMSGLPPVFSFTLQDSKTFSARMQVSDAISLAAPDSEVSAVVGGSRGVFVTNEKGDLKLEKLGRRAMVDLLEINAAGYPKTWVSLSGQKQTLPQNLMLFSARGIDEIFGSQMNLVDSNRGIVFGQLPPERWKQSVEIRVYGPSGLRNKAARIFYFDANNQPRLDLQGSDPADGYFALSGLESGEWHVVLVDAKTKRGLGAQLVRVENAGVAVMQF